jgi:TatD DNase family protein
VLIETHCHLNDRAFAEDRGAVIGRALAAGVEKFVEIACAAPEWEPARSLCAAWPGKFRCAYGLHPEYVKDYRPEQLPELEKFLADPTAAALGEIGVDYWWEPERAEEQRALLEAQLPLSVKYGKPVVFHARNGKAAGQDAYAALASSLKKAWAYFPRGRRHRGVLHCFSGSYGDARAAVDLGLAIGVNGSYTYPRNGDLRETVKKIGLGSIVLETDCPYLPPQSARGKRNDPSFIPEIALAVGDGLGMSVSLVAEKTSGTAAELFGLQG